MDPMFVEDSGKGDAVLLLHGTPSPAADWASVAGALAGRFRVLVPELPGYGRSPMLADSSMENVGGAIAAMLADRGIDQLHAIVGYSTGAYRAFDLLLRHRLPTKLVVSLAGIANFDAAARAMRQQFAEALAADPAFIDSEAVRDAMRELMLSPRWRKEHPEDEARVIHWPRTTSSPALAAELHALAISRDLRPELPRIEAFVYARVGDADVGAPPPSSREIIDAVPRGELDIVPGCGHGLLIEDLAATTEAIVARVNAHG